MARRWALMAQPYIFRVPEDGSPAAATFYKMADD